MSIELPPLSVRLSVLADALERRRFPGNAELVREAVARERILLARVERLELTMQELGLRNAELEAALSKVRRRLECATTHMASDIAKIIDAARGAK